MKRPDRHFRAESASAILAGCSLLVVLLGACATPTEDPCEHTTGTLRIPNNGRVWRVEYEPGGSEEIGVRATLEGSGGSGEATVQMSLPESWIVFTEPGPGFDYQLAIVSSSDGPADIAWSQDEVGQDSPTLFKRLELGCSDALGYAALPGTNNQLTLFNKNDAGQWDQFAMVELLAGSRDRGLPHRELTASI